jgi:hypothetical protein
MNSNKKHDHPTPDKNLAAVCGLFCPACSVYIGTHEDRPRLLKMAERLNMPVEELECDGCRAERRCFFCRNKCTMFSCAAEKGIDFCGSCSEFPCEELKSFQSAMPHRIELWQSHQRIKEAGFQTWYKEMQTHYACPNCKTTNSAYDPECRKCKNTPGNKYTELHKDEIARHLGRMRGE